MKQITFSRRNDLKIPFFILELTVTIKEKGRSKDCSENAVVGEIKAQAVILNDHGHSTATGSPFSRTRF